MNAIEKMLAKQRQKGLAGSIQASAHIMMAASILIHPDYPEDVSVDDFVNMARDLFQTTLQRMDAVTHAMEETNDENND